MYVEAAWNACFNLATRIDLSIYIEAHPVCGAPHVAPDVSLVLGHSGDVGEVDVARDPLLVRHGAY